VHERDLLNERVDGDPVELGPLAEGEHAAAPRPTGHRVIAELIDHKPEHDADVHGMPHMLSDMSHTDTQLASMPSTCVIYHPLLLQLRHLVNFFMPATSRSLPPPWGRERVGRRDEMQGRGWQRRPEVQGGRGRREGVQEEAWGELQCLEWQREGRELDCECSGGNGNESCGKESICQRKSREQKGIARGAKDWRATSVRQT
jgi:hypothetical protein